MMSIVIGFTLGCTDVKPDQETVSNLKTSLASEYFTRDRYTAYSERAEKEGYIQIAKIFKALSVAESVHARNFRDILESLGEKTEVTVPGFIVESTEKNLENAIKEEIMDMDSLYPSYILQSNFAEMRHANNTFTSICEAEKSHRDMLVLIYDMLMTNHVKVNDLVVSSAPAKENLPNIDDLFSKTNFMVCPHDGCVFEESEEMQNCALCHTSNSSLIMID